MATLHARLFSTFRLTAGNRPVEIASGRLQDLLAYLLLHAGERLHRDAVAAALWPDADPAAARRNLREYLYRVRTLLAELDAGTTLDSRGDGSILLTPGPDLTIDVARFQAALLAADAAADPRPALRRAEALYRGDLLADRYDEWISGPRTRLRDAYAGALRRLAEREAAAAALPAAVSAAEALLALDPLDEGTHRQLMRLYLRQGDRAAALAQYHRCRSLLADELDAEPLAETRALFTAIRDEPATPDESTPPRPPFSGRTAALADLTGSPHPLRIVTGDAGSGKSRLVEQWLISLPPETLVLRAPAFEFEHTLPFRPLLDAVRQALNHIPWALLPAGGQGWLAPLGRLLPDLHHHVPALSGDVESGDPALTGAAVGESLIQLLLALVGHRPVVLFLDDLQWADASTWQLLPRLLRRAAGLPLRLVVTLAPAEAPVENRLRRLQQGPATRITLPPATLEEAVHLAAALLPPQARAGDALARRLHAHCGGNFFLLVEIMQALAAQGKGWAGETLPLPESVVSFIAGRLDRLPADSAQALGAAALLEAPFTPQQLGLATGVGEERILDYLEDWLARGLLVDRGDGYRFLQAPLQAVAGMRLSAPRRRRIERRLREQAPD